MKPVKSGIKKWVKENKIVLALFLVSTLFFLYQHYISFSWDFAVYVMNAKYWFAGGSYFEPLRPPLMPFILSILSVFGWIAAEYIYLILVSALFAYSSVKLAESLKMDKNIFYLLSLNVYVLMVGLINGTELLSLALFELFTAALISKKCSGHWLGLACLSRYNIVSFLPLLVFHKSIRKIIKNAVLFSIPFIPWFIYNYAKFGNIFMSIADIYANNIKFRGYIQQPFDFAHVSMVANFLMLFLAAGLIYVIYLLLSDLCKAKSFRKLAGFIFEKRKAEIIMVVVFFGTLYGYSGIPIKGYRYLFNLTMPVVYFSITGINYISSKSRIPKLKFALVSAVVLLNIVSVPSLLEMHSKPDIYADSIERMESLGINDCALKSNAWVFLNYLGRTSHDYPWDRLVGHYIDEGYYILLFYRIGEPVYSRNSTFVHSFPVVYENEEYIILGNTSKCAPITTVDTTYVAAVNRTVTLLYNTTSETDACNLLFEGKFARKLCNAVNFKW